MNFTGSFVRTLNGLVLGPQLLPPATEGLLSPSHPSRNEQGVLQFTFSRLGPILKPMQVS